MDPAGSGGRVGDDPRDARFEAFLEVASPPDLPPDMAAQIRAGLARQYDAPPVEQTALVLRSNCTVDRLRQMIYWPTEEDAELYPALIRSPPPGAPSTHPSARTQVTFLMATYLRHAKDRRFAEAFVLAGGLASLVPLLVHPNLHLRGQAMETFVQFTDEALFPWHEPPRAQSSTDKAMHQRMLELAKQALVPNLTANVVSRARKEGDGENVENDAPTFPGGSGLALRAFAFFASYLRLRHCPGNVLRLSSELLAVLRSVADDASNARSADERALAKTLHDDFSRFQAAPEASAAARSELFPKPGAPDASLDTRDTRDARTVVVLGAGADDACRVVADRTATYGDAEATSSSEDTGEATDAGEAFKKRGNAAFEKGDDSSAIEAYGRAIDAPVSYRRLFDEAPRRATYHANRAAAYLRRGDAADAGAGACDVNGHLENATFPEDFSRLDAHARLLASARAHAEAALLDCDAALEMQSGHAKARFRRAVALWRLGRVAEARRDAERLALAASAKEEEAEARSLMRTLETPYAPRFVTVTANRGVDRASDAAEANKHPANESSADAAASLAGRLFASAALSEREEEARVSFAPPVKSALVFESREAAADGVEAIGGEGDELYDLD